MANGKIIFGKQSGGKLTLVIPDGVSNTEVVVPESGVLATQAYADGKTTLAQVKDEIRTGSNLVTSSTGAVGYGTGSGGTVTQLTSKSTAVTLNKLSGEVLTHNAALAAGASVVFIINNSLVGTYDTSIAIARNGNYDAKAVVVTYGVIYVKITNVSGSSLSDSVPINFTVLKGANS